VQLLVLISRLRLSEEEIDIDIDTLVEKNSFRFVPKTALLKPTKKAKEEFEI